MIPPVIDRIERTGYPYNYIAPAAETKPECECGCAAKLSIQGQLRCWECAEDEGVKKL